MGGPQGLGDRDTQGVELVIGGHLLRQHGAAVILEDDEVANERKQQLRRADARQLLRSVTIYTK